MRGAAGRGGVIHREAPALWECRGGAGRGDCQLTEEQIASRDNGRRRRLRWWGWKGSPGGSLCGRRGTGPPQHHGDHRQHAARPGESSGRGPDWGNGAWDRALLLSPSRGSLRGPSRVAGPSRSCAGPTFRYPSGVATLVLRVSRVQGGRA